MFFQSILECRHVSIIHKQGQHLSSYYSLKNTINYQNFIFNNFNISFHFQHLQVNYLKLIVDNNRKKQFTSRGRFVQQNVVRLCSQFPNQQFVILCRAKKMIFLVRLDEMPAQIGHQFVHTFLLLTEHCLQLLFFLLIRKTT